MEKNKTKFDKIVFIFALVLFFIVLEIGIFGNDIIIKYLTGSFIALTGYLLTKKRIKEDL